MNTLVKRMAALLLAAFLLAAMLPVSALDSETKDVYNPTTELPDEDEPEYAGDEDGETLEQPEDEPDYAEDEGGETALEPQTKEEPGMEDDAAEAELERADDAESADVTVSEAVDEVIELLTRIDSLQEMQDKRKTDYAASQRAISSADYATNNFNQEALVEHEEMAAAYEAYVEGMFVLRAEAKAAYDALSPEEQAMIPEELSSKLEPYDKLDTYFNQRAYTVLTPESEDSPYIYQLIGAYECSHHGCGEIPASMALIDVTDPTILNEEGKWAPDMLYEYGECNYDIVYCSDAHPSPSRTSLYKRINLEDSTYYSRAAARKLRAIVINSYPFVTMDEMKEFLKENGFDSAMADKLDRSEIIAGVQMAIWYYANIGNADHNDLINYNYTFNNYKNPWMPNRIHQFQNEIWTWWDAAGNGQFSAWRPYKTYLSDIEERIDSLVEFLTSLPGQDPDDNQILISDVQITRRQLIPGSNGTYSVGLKVILNHGKIAANDSIILKAEVYPENGETETVITVDLSELTEYDIEVTAHDGDRIRITVDGTQTLAKGVYCYETAAGSRDDQALISVAEGETRIHAEETIVFNREAEIGLRISKVTRGEEHEYPISDIDFNIYAVPESETDIGEVPTPEEVDRIAVPENLVGTITTDNAGYAFIELQYGTYLLVEQPSEKVIAPADPMYFTLPFIRDGDDIVIVTDIAEIIIPNTREDFESAAVELGATKEFNDWGKAESFRFRLEPVTPGAPMPLHDIAVATRLYPLALFERITYDVDCFTGDSNVRTFEYIIKEINDHVPGVTYDTTPHHVFVTVTKTVRIDIENNIRITEIDAEVNYDGEDSLIITNTFTPTTAHFEATKSYDNWGEADSFTFVLAAVTEGAPMPDVTELTVTEASPTAVFAELEFDTVGVYEYTITEVDDGIPGVTYDTTPHQVLVTVSADQTTNALSAVVTYDGMDALIITNTYAPAPCTANPEATKELVGREWNDDDEFIFDIAAVTEGAPMPEITFATAAKDDPIAVFGTIEFTEPGVYVYTITERDGGLPGVTYDTEPHTVTITVTDIGGALEAVIDYDGAAALIITNSYAPAPCTANPEATKELVGREWNDDDEFIFDIAAVTEGAPMPEITFATAAKDDPIAVFGMIEFTELGVYVYTITERNGGLPGVTYDTEPHMVTITVTDIGGALEAVIDYDGESALIVTNTYAPAPCTANPEATKELVGREWNDDDEFIFDIAAVTEGAPMPEITFATATKDDPIAVFGTIEFTEPGVYVYTITERDGGLPGVTYDTEPHIVTITVTDIGGALEAVIDYDGESVLVVTNTYIPSYCTANPEATKELVGREWNDDDEFIFDIAAVTEGAPMPEITSASATKGNYIAVFGTIEFTEPGVYVYTITERNGGLPGVTYDTEPHTVTITVTDIGGALEAVIDYDGESTLIITNTYAPAPCTANPEATKELVGREWNDDDEFIFDIAAVTEGAPMPEITFATAAKDDPIAVFGTIEFTEPGVYVYTITERNGGLPGVTYDTEPHTVTITVTDIGGALQAVIDYDGESALVVTNTYIPSYCTANPEATKELVGREWNDDDEFIFDIAAVTEGAPMPEITSASATKGNYIAVFGTIEFTEPGVYVYTITERNGGLPGVTYDTEPHTVTITVTDIGGALEAVIDYDGESTLIITNTYAPAPCTANLVATKELVGREWNDDDEFIFDIDAVTEGAPMPEITSASATKGNYIAVFGMIEFTEPGVYVYAITERNGGLPGVTYDTESHTVTITVTDIGGALQAVIDYDGAAMLKIVNTYDVPGPEIVTAVIPGLKTIQGIDSTNTVFEFLLEALDPENEGYSETVSLVGAGSFMFSPLEFSEEGVYHFRVTEKAGSTSGWIYDTTVYNITVTVVRGEDGKLHAEVDGLYNGSVFFVNTFITPPPPPPPSTGDDDPMRVGLTLAAVFTAAAACFVTARIRRRKEQAEN